MTTVHVDLEAEWESVEGYRVAWEREKAKEEAVIAECNATHTTPPANHWVPEFRARGKYLLALGVYEVLNGG